MKAVKAKKIMLTAGLSLMALTVLSISISQSIEVVIGGMLAMSLAAYLLDRSEA